MSVTIGRPEPAPDMPEVWQCRYSIEGLGEPVDERGCGDDSMAALLNAFVGIRHDLDRSGLRWQWPNGTERQMAMPLLPPLGLFPDQIEAFERYIRDQEAEFARRARERARALGHDMDDDA